MQVEDFKCTSLPDVCWVSVMEGYKDKKLKKSQEISLLNGKDNKSKMIQNESY